ncbi:TPA: heat-shock protein [Klebsiella pneumoniae]|nr:heat-shock protein [Klebsiella pneumoniae]HBU1912530.1 heat-shock protein [Klebsiella pneumoniae]HBU2417766.1 heat-shock protein [Klebsiella pneumoniae]HBU2423212.1 heat-shock protein [Klebsiella pneumoniae]
MISYQELVRTFLNQAQLDSGILKIAIHQEIPESEKPRKIAIENQGRVIEHKV